MYGMYGYGYGYGLDPTIILVLIGVAPVSYTHLLSSEAARMCIRLRWKPRQRSQIFNGGDRWKDGGSLHHYGRQSAF